MKTETQTDTDRQTDRARGKIRTYSSINKK